MAKIVLKLDERKDTGKQLRKLRALGWVPSVVYSDGNPGVNTQSKQVETLKVVEEVGRHTPFQVELNGKKQLVIIKTLDIDPVKHSIKHLAMQGIRQDEMLETEVEIQIVGLSDSQAEKAGLVILQAIDKINIKALPADLPESLSVDGSTLEDEESKITVADIKLPEGVEYADVEQDLELVVANVYEPSALEAANAAAAGDGTDVEDVESEQGASEEEAASSADESSQ